MDKKELKQILENHRRWLNDEGGARANLMEADLTGADLDFSVLPLWCGSFGMKVDRNIYTQILYHLCRLDVDDEECREHQKMSMELANKADVRERHNLREIE